MSKWVWVTAPKSDKRTLLNFDMIETIEVPTKPEAVNAGAGSCLTWQGGSLECHVKETPEAIYAEIHGPPLAYLDHLRGAIVVEAHEQELYAPQERTKDIGAPDLTWGSFADAVVMRLRNG